ncbi:MAG: GLUG motif-containing protein [Planctomycetota bacterium]|jgi:hypothetical protein
MPDLSKTFGKLTMPLFVLLAISFSALPAQAKYGGGTGEPNDPYLIYDANQMNAIGADTNDWGSHFMLVADIDLGQLTGEEFNIIAPDMNDAVWWFEGVPFTGVFDGNDHTISNFTYNSNSINFIGLFGCIDGRHAQIKNLTLDNPNVNPTGDSWSVGALAGMLKRGTITGCAVEGGSISGDYRIGGMVGIHYGTMLNCHATSSVRGDFGDAGGLVGSNASGMISNCYAQGSVSGGNEAGGLVGDNQWGTILNCYATGNLPGANKTGGLVGLNLYGTISNCYATGDILGWASGNGGLVGGNSGAISNCYATGSVSGDGTGGLVGNNDSAISNCYATGSVTGGVHTGGLVGGNSGLISASFWDTETSGQANGVGNGSAIGVTAKTTAQMQTMITFFGWGCEPTVWTIDDGNDYPHLAWESSPGTPISPTLSDFLEGAGTQNEPYLIYTADELNTIGLFSCECPKQFKLMADIDLGSFSPTEFNIIAVFAGVFDGNGHTISKFTYHATDAGSIGLFSYVYGANAAIKDLTLSDPSVNAMQNVGSLVAYLLYGRITGCGVEGGSVSGSGYGETGGLVGRNDNGRISNCHATLSVSGTGLYTGGLVGANFWGTITDCYSTGNVTGNWYGGGLLGYSCGSVSNCYATGSVSGDHHTGGLVGRNLHIQGRISNCYATGPVDGNEYTGGLVGVNHGGGTISDCYAAGSVSGYSDAGGLVGNGDANHVATSFWDVNTTGQSTSAGGTGKTTAEMQMQVTFTDAGWDFITPIWKMNCEGMSYPKLSWWQRVLGDFGCPDGVNFVDFSFFAGHWQEDNCGASNDCEGADLDQLGTVDINDLGIFADNWLAGS